MTMAIDAYARSTARFGEEQSGDAARLFYGKDTVTAVLVGGGGGAVRACVLSGMVVSMFGSALSHPVTVVDAVDTVVGMLPPGNPDGIVAFTVSQVHADGTAYLAWISMPPPVLLRRGHVYPLPYLPRQAGGRLLQEAHLQLKPRDTLVSFGSGVAQAGDGVPCAAGWAERLLPAYLEAAYQPAISAEKMAELLLNVSCSLCGEKPPNDLSAAVFRYKTRREAKGSAVL